MFVFLFSTKVNARFIKDNAYLIAPSEGVSLRMPFTLRSVGAQPFYKIFMQKKTTAFAMVI